MKLAKIFHDIVADEFVVVEVTGKDAKVMMRFDGKWHEMNSITFSELVSIAESLLKAVTMIAEDISI